MSTYTSYDEEQADVWRSEERERKAERFSELGSSPTSPKPHCCPFCGTTDRPRLVYAIGYMCERCWADIRPREALQHEYDCLWYARDRIKGAGYDTSDIEKKMNDIKGRL